MFATLMMFANDTTTATTSAATAAGARRSPQMDPAGIFFYDGSDGCIANDGGPGFVGSATMSTTPKQEEKKMNKNKRGDHDSDYEAEYKQLARDELEDMLLTGELPDFASGQARWNERKNRYSNNLPLERTRVKLAPRPHTPGSDYINASYIHAPAASVHACHAKAKDDNDDVEVVEEAEYIAAQAPLAGTCGDFWRMVAERGAGLVVMLTRLREGERTKATRYWPRRVGRTTRFGEVRVRLVSVHSHYGPARDDLIVRRFLIRRVRVPQQQLNQQQQHDDDGMHDDDDGHDNNNDNDTMTSEESEVEGEESGEGEWREVVHLHYQAWPDFGRPATDSFRELLRLVDDFHVAHAGPIVTHCSAGLGRTGVLIAAHIALAQLRRTAAAAAAEVVRPDVYATVRHIRKQRSGMVQTLEQFTFIHEVVNDLLAEREAAASIMTTTTTTTSTITDTTAAATTTSRARASAHTATKRCSSSSPRISSGRSSARGGGGFSTSLGWSATSAPSASSGCCSLVDDLMDYDTTTSCAAELGLASAHHHHHKAAVRREQQRGRQGLCCSTPAICMRV